MALTWLKVKLRIAGFEATLRYGDREPISVRSLRLMLKDLAMKKSLLLLASIALGAGATVANAAPAAPAAAPATAHHSAAPQAKAPVVAKHHSRQKAKHARHAAARNKKAAHRHMAAKPKASPTLNHDSKQPHRPG
jgi:hypothetical protein